MTGVGDKAFCAGADLGELIPLMTGTREPQNEFDRRYADDISKKGMYLINNDPVKPVIAAINGHAIAGGCILALACDYRVASAHPKVRIGLTELALGVAFPPGVFKLLQSRLPSAHQDELMLGAGLHAPERALALGLVDAVAEDPVAAGRERLEQLAGYPSSTYVQTKRALHTVDFAAACAVPGAWDMVLDAWMSDEVRGRMKALVR